MLGLTPAQVIVIIVLVVIAGIGICAHIFLKDEALNDEDLDYEDDDYDEDDDDDDDDDDDIEYDPTGRTIVVPSFATIGKEVERMVMPGDSGRIFRVVELDRQLRPWLYSDDWYEFTRAEFSRWAAQTWRIIGGDRERADAA